MKGKRACAYIADFYSNVETNNRTISASSLVLRTSVQL